MKKDIAIYGAGGLGREMVLLLDDIGGWNLLGFYDDGKEKGSFVDDQPILGGLADINAATSPLSMVLGISDPIIKEKLTKEITNPLINFPTLIHPACIAGDKKYNTFGKGVVLAAGTILTTHVDVANFVLINLAVTIGHDVSIGAFTSIMPGVSISGAVTIGERSSLGTGSRILQSIKLGPDTVVGAGAVVTKSFPGAVTLVGVPATKIA